MDARSKQAWYIQHISLATEIVRIINHSLRVLRAVMGGAACPCCASDFEQHYAQPAHQLPSRVGTPRTLFHTTQIIAQVMLLTTVLTIFGFMSYCILWLLCAYGKIGGFM